MTGIKETMDVINVLDEALGAAERAMEDGTISFIDMKELITLVGPAKEAIAGVTDIASELKDLDSVEVAEISAKMFLVVKRVLNLVGKVK